MLSVVVAVFAEFVLPGRLGLVAILVPIGGYAAATLLVYVVFRPVSPRLSIVAAAANLVSLGFEASLFQPYGVNVGVGLHGGYLVALAALVLRSTIFPRILGVVVGCGGVAWLARLVPQLAHSRSPIILIPGFIAELSLCLWLLVMGTRPGPTKTESVSAHGSGNTA